MPIDTANETVLSLTDAAKALPALDGKRPHASTVFRWMKNGCRGVRLEFGRVGHRIFTSREALARFMAALATAEPQPRPKPEAPEPRIRTTERRAKDIAKARAELAAMGI